MAKPQFAPTPQAYALANTLNGAVLSVYLGGTTTPAPVYSDRALTTSLGTTLTADSLGRFANFFVDASTNYKYVLSHSSIADITFDYSVTSNELLDSTAEVVEQFAGNGVTVAFTSVGNELTDGATLVAIDGLVQAKGTYTVAFGGTDTVITFDAAPPDGAVIDVWNLLLLGAQGPAGPAVADGDKGDIVVSSTGTVWTIDTGAVSTAKVADNAVTYAKMQNVSAASRLLGRGSASGAGDPEELTVGTGLAISGTVLSSTAGGLPRSYLAGLGMANNSTDPTNDIDFAAGACRDSTNAADITCSALTKRLDATWAAGTGNGGLDTGTVSNTTYHCFAIKKDSDGTGDFLFSTSATAPTMPSGYTYFRRIGSIVRSAGAILTFKQNGDIFTWDAPVLDVSATTTGTSATSRTLTLPTGVAFVSIIVARLSTYVAGSVRAYISALENTDQTPSSSIYSLYAESDGTNYDGDSQIMWVVTNTSAQVRTRLSASNVNIGIHIVTKGWIDRRGRDS